MPDNKLQEAVSGRIRALMAKTIENGATEAEAMSAAAKARELMDKYRLTMSDVEIQAEPIVTEDVDREHAVRTSAADYCLPGLRAYCGVQAWYYKTHGGPRRVRLFGLKADVEMARYLYEMIGGAVTVETRAFFKTPAWKNSLNRRNACSSFQVGMTCRINARLQEMAAALAPIAKTANGTALVVVKGALVKEAFDALHLRFSSSSRSGMPAGDGGAYLAGRAAGERVNLSRPVSSAGTRMIGG